MKLSRYTLMLWLLATGAPFATPAQAAIIVDTGATATAGGRPLNEAQALAGYFTLGVATTITSAEGMIGGDGATGTIAIFSGGVDPASSTRLFSGSFTIAESRPSSYQGVFGQNWNLAAGSYWVGFFTDGTNFISSSATNPLSRHAVRPFDNIWVQHGPDLALGIRMIGNVTPGAVPEPATWAMMTVGFGLVGGMMRRRVAKVSYG